jgi:hypothetical protein
MEPASKIETAAQSLHQILFEPELQRPVKTLDLPLGGSKGVRSALEVLIEFMLIAVRNQAGRPSTVADQDEDGDGAGTLNTLAASLRLARRITGNDSGSLGLHPAVYFYGPSGVHSGPMFMGTVALIGQRLACNDSSFFAKFTAIRMPLEQVLIAEKELIAAILQKHSSRRRTESYRELLWSLIGRLTAGQTATPEWLIETSGLKGKLVTGGVSASTSAFSDNTKSSVFIASALGAALKCAVCGGYIDMEKSVSYDHVMRVRDGGLDEAENCQLTHPYCNQSIRR